MTTEISNLRNSQYNAKVAQHWQQNQREESDAKHMVQQVDQLVKENKDVDFVSKLMCEEKQRKIEQK